MIMGREGKKYQTYKVSITWTIGDRPHPLFFFLFLFSSFTISFHILSFKRLTLTWSNDLTSHGVTLNKK